MNPTSNVQSFISAAIKRIADLENGLDKLRQQADEPPTEADVEAAAAIHRVADCQDEESLARAMLIAARKARSQQ